MMFFIPFRMFHCSSLARSAITVNKNLLGELRKSTGYSISHCKKALQLHDNNIQEANKWLASQAQAEGWAKATKLAGRTIKQGLLGISVTSDNTQAAVIELNCETDFVARNSVFRNLAQELTEVCLSSNFTRHYDGNQETLLKETWNSEQVSQLQTSDGKTMADKVALTIGLLGENMALSRAIKMSTGRSDVKLYGYSHPAPITGCAVGAGSFGPLLGRFGAVVALRATSDTPTDPGLIKHLCLQIIGMQPEFIGTPEEIQQHLEVPTASHPDTPAVDSTATEHVPQQEDAPVIVDKTPLDRFLLKQNWLEDEDITVEQVLEEAGLVVVDFVRMQVGDVTNN